MRAAVLIFAALVLASCAVDHPLSPCEQMAFCSHWIGSPCVFNQPN